MGATIGCVAVLGALVVVPVVAVAVGLAGGGGSGGLLPGLEERSLGQQVGAEGLVGIPVLAFGGVAAEAAQSRVQHLQHKEDLCSRAEGCRHGVEEPLELDDGLAGLEWVLGVAGDEGLNAGQVTLICVELLAGS